MYQVMVGSFVQQDLSATPHRYFWHQLRTDLLLIVLILRGTVILLDRALFMQDMFLRPFVLY